MSNKYKRKGKEKFIMLPRWFYRSAAWCASNPVERSAYLEVLARYDGFNNGYIGLSCRELAAALNVSKNTASRALSGLKDKGFISLGQASGFNVKGRVSNEYRLTNYKCDRTGNEPSKEFAKWQPTTIKKAANKNSTVPLEGQTVPPLGHKLQNSEEKATCVPYGVR